MIKQKEKMNKCPVCGGQLMVEECCQYSVVHFITAYGKASKKAKRRDYGGIGHSCINGTFLDELDPDAGRMEKEIMQDCGIMCYLVLNEEDNNV